jgi:magnesium chelatase subunit I
LSNNYKSLVEQSYNSNPKYTEIRSGLPEDYKDIKTLSDLLAINYKIIDVKEQLRRNLIFLMQTNSNRYPGIIGFDNDVIPSLDRAILSGHDVFLIGQIGQAKTKLVEIIAETLLSPIPVIENSITNDCPMDLPKEELIALLEEKENHSKSTRFYISPESSEKIRENKLDTPLVWVDGKSRYKYVLATPDISVKDLVGFIDAVKIAKKGIEMYKIESYSPGQLMQAKHGIFCIDELPVLDPRKQVALLSVLQEGRFTTGPYPVIFEPKTVVFATANPIDYTHSGKVIEPLFDRLKSHIHTHYPKTIEDEMLIILQEAKTARALILPPILKAVANIVQKARNAPAINHERGVSVRLGIHGLELLAGEAERTRSIPYKSILCPRISDMHCLIQIAKFELAELDNTFENREKVFNNLVKEAVKEICLDYLKDVNEPTLQAIKQEFTDKTFQVSQNLVWKDGQFSYENQLVDFPNLKKLVYSKLSKVISEQDHLKQLASKHGFSSKLEIIDSNGEMNSTLLETILEGLCWTTPKILDKKETYYAGV